MFLFVLLILGAHLLISPVVLQSIIFILPVQLDIRKVFHVSINRLSVTRLLIVNFELLLKHFVIIVLRDMDSLWHLLWSTLSLSIKMSVDVPRAGKIQLESRRLFEEIIASSSKRKIEW